MTAAVKTALEAKDLTAAVTYYTNWTQAAFDKERADGKNPNDLAAAENDFSKQLQIVLDGDKDAGMKNAVAKAFTGAKKNKKEEEKTKEKKEE